MGKAAPIPAHDNVAKRLAEKTLAAVMSEDLATSIDTAKAEDIMVLLAQIKLIAHDGILCAQVLIAGDGVGDEGSKLLVALGEIKKRLVQAGKVLQ